jgi:uncharacterized damage-inducible protein DinB
MSTTDLHSTRRRETREALAGAREAWLQDVTAQFSLLRTTATGRVAPKDALAKVLQLTKGLVEANVKYVQRLSTASFGIAGAVRDGGGQAVHAVKADVADAARSIHHRVAGLEDDAEEAATELRRTERAEARRAKRAAQDAAAERYQTMTKVELSEELMSRSLPKTGNVAELRARLIENDRQAD